MIQGEEKSLGESPLNIWEPILSKARKGSIFLPPIGEPGSVVWKPGDEVPKTLILCDVFTKPCFFPPFPVSFAFIEELDLSGNSLLQLPEGIINLKSLRCLFLGGFPDGEPYRKNIIESLPSLALLTRLEHLSVHDTLLRVLPQFPVSLRTLRVDRCPLERLPDTLPPLTTLHLEGCPLPGTLERPDLLPDAVKELQDSLEDLQLPDGSHIGIFFGIPVAEAVSRVVSRSHGKE
jgi:hypothetical protein